MAQTISNKFFVQVIDDGATLHGEIRATKSLTQSYTGTTCVPNWTVTDNQPIIYISLMNGTTFIVPDSTYTWYYNGTAITWDSNGKSNAVGSLVAGTFEKVTNYTPSGYNTGEYVPAIKIVKNLASSSNVDIDVIRFDGQATLTTNPVAFSASLNVTITEWLEGGGYLGVINFTNGIADIDSTHTSVTCNAVLYNGDGNAITTGVTYKWYKEGDSSQVGSSASLTVTDSMVVDYAVFRCEFWMTVDGTSTNVATARVGIDDTQDPEYMWIQYNGANGNSASLRSGESVSFTVWVGKADDPTYVYTTFTSFKVKLFDSTGATITADLKPTFADPDSSGYRTLNVSSNKATFTVTYNIANTYGKKGLTGIILASTSA